jgi:putative membrane protein
VPNPWRFELHAEVIVLVAFLAGAYTYLVRSVGPVAVRAGGAPITRKNIVAFVAAMAMLFTASWWPLHDIGENYLYSAHMLQHMMLSYFLPPLVWLATPEWLMRTLIGNGRLYRAIRWLCHPVVAGVVFNLAVIVTHVPGVVNASVDNGALHYALHVMVVSTSLLMWMPVCGPIPEFRIGTAGTMIYLFLQSVVPTVPAAWLTFAEGTVYAHYGEQPLRLWGISIVSDQQLAGAIMKTGGSIFLWSIIVTLWFKRFAAPYRSAHDYKRRPDATAAGADDVLTFEDVEREFAASPAVREP